MWHLARIMMISMGLWLVLSMDACKGLLEMRTAAPDVTGVSGGFGCG